MTRRVSDKITRRFTPALLVSLLQPEKEMSFAFAAANLMPLLRHHLRRLYLTPAQKLNHLGVVVKASSLLDAVVEQNFVAVKRLTRTVVGRAPARRMTCREVMMVSGINLVARFVPEFHAAFGQTIAVPVDRGAGIVAPNLDQILLQWPAAYIVTARMNSNLSIWFPAFSDSGNSWRPSRRECRCRSGIDRCRSPWPPIRLLRQWQTYRRYRNRSREFPS